ncbi:MAG: carbohydrate ABC transporter permease [Devosia sp.]|uniref:carbohydrate ABC transporter permease n=1 Tax=Devosia sp. 66-22 TaxID=1895753 RepID=UPI001AC684CA|nr:carbohydrate ABC transporter permease [Devosia sp. 66-22]MBN9348477.1 carbohydrate ABC transporter permease [Devosia sp.]
MLNKVVTNRNVIMRRIGDVLLGIVLVLMLAPFAFAVLTAIRPAADVANDPLGLPTRITAENVATAFAQMNYAQSLWNTVLILFGTSVLTITLGSMASYPLSRIGKRWTRLTYQLFIIGTSVPIWVLIAPLYLFMRDLGLLGSFAGVILIYTAGLLPVAIFFYTSFIRQVPTELEEAASIDGAGSLRIFFLIVFPLLGPMTVTLITYIALSVWNDLIVPIIFLQGIQNGTIMSNAYALLNPLVVQPTTLFPAILLGVIPLIVLFAVLQRYVIAGLTSGAIK